MFKQNHHSSSPDQAAKGEHVPVLLEEVLRYLQPQPGDTYLDLTAGYGGHAHEVLQRTQAPDRMVLIDRDAKAVKALKNRFGEAMEIRHDDFFSASQALLVAGKKFDCILADLGISSPHLDNASRGFSFKTPARLDMRMDQSQSVDADRLVNEASLQELIDILSRYGEEPKAAKIAQAIIDHRPVKTTTELADIVATQWPGYHRIHPATRTFQALRIAVNDELGLIERALPLWLELLKPGGRLAVISFHSLEDRLVKRFFAEYGGNRYDAILRLLTKSPVTPSPQEIAFNPRARSAKLRAAVKQT